MFTLLPVWVSEKLVRREVIAFYYHAVSDEPMPHVKHLYPAATVRRFENDLRYLKRAFSPVSYADVHAHIVDGASLPRRAVHLTFDDGFRECFSVVRPLLLKYKIPCTFFVTTDWIDNQGIFYRNLVSLCIEGFQELGQDARRMYLTSLNHALDLALIKAEQYVSWIKSRTHADGDVIQLAAKMLGIDVSAYLQSNPIYLTREQILQMHAEGFTIGAHTRAHPKLSRVPKDVMEAEILESVRVVQELTGDGVVPFSFPFSAGGVERKELAEIRKRNDNLGLLFDTMGIQPDERFIVNRIWGERATPRMGKNSAALPGLVRAAYGTQIMKDILGRAKGDGNEVEEI